jgi:hypothetical protein
MLASVKIQAVAHHYTGGLQSRCEGEHRYWPAAIALEQVKMVNGCCFDIYQDILWPW